MSPILITGMHRSGTSALARMIQGLGVNVGSDLLVAAGGNVYGHFEENSFLHFHDKLIARMFPKRAPFCEWLPLADTDETYTDAERAEARSIWKAHSAKGGNAWKDPRTSLFLDLWLGLLPDAKLVICLRHPYQSHISLLRRGEPFLHVDYAASIAGWSVYNQRILRVISKLPRSAFIVIDVEQGFRESQRLSEGLSQFLNLPVTEKALGSIDPEVFHFEDDCHEAVPHFGDYFPEAELIYRQLKQFDLIDAELFPAPSRTSTLHADESRLIEFEVNYGLREKAKRMLIRSITVDRKRTEGYYKHLGLVNAERDKLIEDISKLNAQMKKRIADLEAGQRF